MTILPLSLIFTIVIIVILPSVVTAYLRFALYDNLVYIEGRVRRLTNKEARGTQPKIITELERRFKEASSNLDQVNTAALIEQAYNQEKIWLFSYEQIEYFCRTLPNLLLAFGLFGTFLGITISLTLISQTSTTDVNNLLQEIQQPLKGMGIAFITSLVGIFFSTVLTLVNLFKNTNLAKYKLISALEDYLDNIYLPEVQGSNRLDKAVDRLVFEFQDFLGRFGTTVREAVESSLGAKIQQIVDVNKQSSELARKVYTGFQESSGTIASAATELKYAVSNFETAVAAMIANAEKYQQVAQTFENSQFPQKLSQATADLANVQSNFSLSASSLANTAESIEMAVTEMRTSSQNTIELTEKVSRTNQTSIQVLELHRNNQQSLGEIIPQLHHAAESFKFSIKTLEQLQKKIEDGSDSWKDIQTYLTKLVENLKNSTEQVNQRVQTLGDRVVDSITNQTENDKQHSQVVLKQLQKCATHLNDSRDEAYKLNKILEKQVISQYRSVKA